MLLGLQSNWHMSCRWQGQQREGMGNSTCTCTCGSTPLQYLSAQRLARCVTYFAANSRRFSGWFLMICFVNVFNTLARSGGTTICRCSRANSIISHQHTNPKLCCCFFLYVPALHNILVQHPWLPLCCQEEEVCVQLVVLILSVCALLNEWTSFTVLRHPPELLNECVTCHVDHRPCYKSSSAPNGTSRH